MPRRVNLPGASELFRGEQAKPTTRARSSAPDPDAEPTGPTRRVRHDEKITVYVSSAELLGLEQARLDLRGQHGIAVDRGRLVREAIDMALADLAEHGDSSELVRRLSQP
ncbi:hypothetical protein [Aestuariimicrobium ganziense]|uniref:hypothetical protein n=1 Tax=Aestuariimicrobium ganziense TaxID=2773677 RepID=UPI00194484E2|nr:hypothetical protein [Aestuariimicrobium ganziense]